MKLLLLTALVAGAFAAPKPVIQLRMNGNLVEQYNPTSSIPTGVLAGKPADHQSDLQKLWNDNYQANQDHVFNCAYDAPADCHMPVASAKDHHDSSVAIAMSVEVVDNIAKSTKIGSDAGISEVQCNKDYVHKTQIFKYDATDYSGNKAEQVTVAFFIYDIVKPYITPCSWTYNDCDGQTMEATHKDYYPEHWPADQFFPAGKFNGCLHGQQQTQARDEVDGDLTHLLEETIQHNGGGDFQVNGIGVNTVGTWTVNYKVMDKSKNSAEATKTIEVVDTLKPIIHMNQHGYTDKIDVTLECAATYVDAGAVCTDRLDGTIDAAPKYTVVNNVDNTHKGDYTVVYNCKDDASHNADTQTRHVTVTDTSHPTAKLGPATGDVQATIQLWAGLNTWVVDYTDHSGDNTHTDAVDDADKHKSALHYGTHDQGVVCTDACSEYTIHDSKEFDPEFNGLVAGTYIETYTCTDDAGLVDTVTRTIEIIDKRDPLIILNGDNPAYIEAAPGYVYNDAGATCTDEVDGDLSQDMVVKGQNVNGALVGEYTITYDCTDAAGNSATSLVRTVKVEDNTDPTLYMNSKDFMVIEASFPYNDPGATAWDSLDKDITAKITSNAADVDPFAKQGAHVHTPGSVSKFDDPSVTGVYHVKYEVSDNDGNAAEPLVRTVVVKDTLPPVIQLLHGGNEYGHYKRKYDQYPFDKEYSDNTYAYSNRENVGHTADTGVTGFKPPAGGYLALNEESSNNKQIAFVAGLVVAVGGIALLALKKRNTQAKTYVMV